MDTKIIALLINHTAGTFRIMEDQVETLDLILFNDFGDITGKFGDCFNSYIQWHNDQEITLETYRSNSNDYRADVARRLNDLISCEYTEI